MNNRLSFPNSTHSVIETLENRTFLSAVPTPFDAGSASERSAMAAALVRKAATRTTLAVSAGTLGQPVTFTVTVRAAAAAGSPQGTVNIIDHRKVIETITLAPTTSSSPRFAFSDATVTLNQQPGDTAYFFGRHAVSALFIPAGAFLRSAGVKIFTVSKPAYTALPDGVKIATIAAGSGPAIRFGQNASLFYTGYLARNGRLVDDSINDGGTPLDFMVGDPQLLTGFSEGTIGMQAGETRIVLMPPAEAYGRFGSPPAVPGNATLIFVLTLESIS